MKINGKKVVDATKPVKITITPKDIAKGDNKNPSGCAAARSSDALGRKLYFRARACWTCLHRPGKAMGDCHL